jgi:Na+-driven multidrug efflux pump
VAIHSAAFTAVLAASGSAILGVFASKGDAAFADGFSAAARALVLILCAKALFESAALVLQAYLRGRGETAAVFRIQFATSLLFWIPLFLAVRAFAPGIPAYWLTMPVSSALACAALWLRARLPTV